MNAVHVVIPYKERHTTMIVRGTGTGGVRQSWAFTEGVGYNESAGCLYKIVSWISFMTYILLRCSDYRFLSDRT
jgi:hypothetical protein